MDRKIIFSLLIAGMVIIGICGDGHTSEAELKIDKISVGSQFTALEGDEGRYRQDNYVTDSYTGGIEELIMSGHVADASLGVNVHALFDHDYGFNLDLTKEDAYFLNVDTRQMRRYYDGSTDQWDPVPYELPSNFADREDGHMYVDRLNSSVEVGLLFDSLPNFTFGWTRWDRDGEETLARGSRARATGLDDFRGIPAWRQVDGWSDTFFVKFDQQLAEIHNVSLKQEYETYRDEQRIIYPRYQNGAVQEFRVFEDLPSFNESLTHASYNSFLNDKTYLTGNYLYQHLKNTTKRSHLRTNYLTPNNTDRFINPEVNNRRDAHIVNFGAVLLDGLVKNLRIGANVRFEKAITKNEGEGNRYGRDTRLSESEQDDAEYSESLSLSYSGIKRTNLSLVLESDQRKLNLYEKADVTDHELVTDFGWSTLVPTNILVRDTNIRHNDLTLTLQGTHRLDNKNKVTAKYKRANKRRKYEDVEDNGQTFYPGYLGSSKQEIDQFLVRYDSSFIENWVAGFEYTFEYNELGYAIQNGVDGQQIKRNRLSTNLTGTLTDDLTVHLMAMGERYDLDIPANGSEGTITRYAAGESVYNYEVESYIGSVGGHYRFNDKTSSSLTYQHTEVTGTIRNGLDELVLGVDHSLGEDDNIEVSLEWFNFNNKILGGQEGFDDYKGIVTQLIYNKDF